MPYRAAGAWTILLAVAHGCAPASSTSTLPTPVHPEVDVRRIENPRDRSVSLVLDPIEVDAGLSEGRLRVGGMFVQSGTGAPDGGAVLVLQLDRTRPEEVFSEGARMQMEADGVRSAVSAVRAGTLHRSRRTESGWQETLLVPVDAADLRRLAHSHSAELHLLAGPTFVLDGRLRAGLQRFVRRLPDTAFDDVRAVRARASAQSEESPSTQPR